jgi:hypothetical protein
MHNGDWLIYYSPRISLDSTEQLQAFTALGQIADDEIYQVEESQTFKPFRRRVKYLQVVDADIGPLIPSLSFIKNKKSWGYAFRYGLVEIPKIDFDLISSKMMEGS